MKLFNQFYKFIYCPSVNQILRNISLPFKKHLPNNARIPPSGIVKLKTDSGILKLKTNQTSYLTQLLFWNGYQEFEYSKIFELLSKDVRVFLDIGANIGYYSLLATISNPKVKVYAFEPAQGPKYYLNQNIELNSFENNIELIDKALSNQKGEIEFYEVANKKYEYLKYNLAGEGNAGTKKTSRNFVKTRVNTLTLNSFTEKKNVSKIDLIKIDTEGTEFEILKSGEAVIRKFKPIVICETLFNVIEADLEGFFVSMDYLMFNHTINGLEEVGTLRRNIDNGIRNCFFVPKSKIELIKPFIYSI